jgi:CreA protein
MKKETCFVLGILVGVIMMITLLTVNPVHAGVKAVQIGEVDCVKRMIQGNDTIKVIRIVDPDNPFVAIFFTTIKSGQLLAMADPSNTAIAARLIAPVPVKDGKRQIDTRTVTDIASVSKSIGSKVMKIARFYDKKMDTLCYVVYTTKLLDGSLKHSLSVVPLGMPLGVK